MPLILLVQCLGIFFCNLLLSQVIYAILTLFFPEIQQRLAFSGYQQPNFYCESIYTVIYNMGIQNSNTE